MSNYPKNQLNSRNLFSNQAHKNLDKKLAFSLLELSIVILVISGLMVAIIKGSDLISSSKIAAARQQTLDSPVEKIGSLAVWFETTLDNSFLIEEKKNNGQISQWNNIGNSNLGATNDAIQGTTSKKPIYIENAINGLPVLRFDGDNTSSSNGDNLDFDISIQNDFTIFAVAKNKANQTDNSACGTETNSGFCSYDGKGRFLLSSGYLRGVTRAAISFATNKISISEFDDVETAGNKYFAMLTNYSGIIGEKPNIISWRLKEKQHQIFLNGKFLKSGVVGLKDDVFAPKKIGGNNVSQFGYYWGGDVGEVIIFSKSLNDNERKDVEEYLSKKWGVDLGTDSCPDGYYLVSGICSRCIGGEIKSIGNEVIHKFTVSSIAIQPLYCKVTKTARVLVVAAGGSGGSVALNATDAAINPSYLGGGGGGGGVIEIFGYGLSYPNPNSVEVGDGKENYNGGNSSINNIVAFGGGRGGYYENGAFGVVNGGSGGGGAFRDATPKVGGAGVSGQGNSGGPSSMNDCPTINVSGGGGGAGGAGGAGGVGFAGVGGVGFSSDIEGMILYYGAGGSGVGSSNGGCNTKPIGLDGMNGFGRGGNGGSNSPLFSRGGKGGSGVVIVRYENN